MAIKMVKVLIADDEAVECEALEEMIHGLFPGVTVIPSVYDGIALVDTVEKERPDIVVVDINMPGLNGLEALEILRAKNIRMEIIIHTAYSKFDYIHKALKMGASDFLVKPVFEEDFAESFSYVLEGVEEKKRIPETSLKWMPETVNVVIEKNIMMSLLLKKPDETSWKLFQKSIGHETGAGMIVAFSVDSHKKEEKVFSALLSKIKKYSSCLSIIHQKILYCYLFTDEGIQEENYREWLTYWLLPSIRKLGQEHDMEIQGGVSMRKDKFEQMTEAIEESNIALQNEAEKHLSFYHGENRKLASNIFVHMAKQIAKDMEEKNLRQAMEDIACVLRENGREQEIEFASCFYAEEMMVNAALLLDLDKRRTGMRWTIQERLKDLIQENLDQGIWEETEVNASVVMPYESFMAYMEKELERIEEDLKRPVRKPNPYIEKALLYMERNYMKDISLESTAEQIGITQFYLSRLFKQEKNQTFLDILTNIRISRAIRLLMDPSRTVQNVSTMVGYAVKYFYRIFKSVTGISQKEFRDGLLQNKD